MTGWPLFFYSVAMSVAAMNARLILDEVWPDKEKMSIKARVVFMLAALIIATAALRY